jgi:hypothetical protein
MDKASGLALLAGWLCHLRLSLPVGGPLNLSPRANCASVKSGRGGLFVGGGLLVKPMRVFSLI